MAQDGPALALSDIIHTMSPSPSQPNDDDPLAPPASTSPEPLDLAQIEIIKKRLTEIHPHSIAKPNMSPVEQELADMVLRLTSYHIPDPTQLHEQADTIFDLNIQREYLTKEFADERIRWEAERDNFSREAEALIARRSRGGESTYREEELERQVLTLDADNKALRQKISEYHARLQSLEGEIAQLRPILLMQPYALTHSFPYPHSHNAGPSSKNDIHVKSSRRRKHTQPPAILPDHAATDDEADGATERSTAVPKPKPPRGDYYRRRDTDVFNDSSKHKRPRTHKKGGTALANARSEHLLLAMRRIGRERASYLSGFPSGIDREREGRENDASTPVPKTPKKPLGTRATINGPSSNAVFSSAQPMSLPVAPGTPAIQTPQASRQRQSDRATRNNPHTPLDSLITAARSISMIEEDDIVDDEIPPPSHKASSRRAAEAASPVPPKRRRLAGSSTAASLSRLALSEAGHTDTDHGRTDESISRTRSALDILADQAAVSSSKEKTKVSERGKGKGKEKARENSAGSDRLRASSTLSRARNNLASQGVRTRGRAAAESLMEAHEITSTIGSRSVTSASSDRVPLPSTLNVVEHTQRVRTPPPTPSWIRKERGQDVVPTPTSPLEIPYPRAAAPPSDTASLTQHERDSAPTSILLTPLTIITNEDNPPVTMDELSISQSKSLEVSDPAQSPVPEPEPEPEPQDQSHPPVVDLPPSSRSPPPIHSPDHLLSQVPAVENDVMMVDEDESRQVPTLVPVDNLTQTSITEPMEAEQLDDSLDMDAEGEIDDEVAIPL